MNVPPFLAAAVCLYALMLPSLLRRASYFLRRQPDPVPTGTSQWVCYWLQLASIPTWVLPAWVAFTILLGLATMTQDVVTVQNAAPTLFGFAMALVLDQGMRVQRQLRLTS